MTLYVKLGLIVAALAALGGLYGCIRHDAAVGARNEVAVEAAHAEQEVRREGDKAADVAARDGGIKRMRAGDF